jgi:hypothetical protein
MGDNGAALDVIAADAGGGAEGDSAIIAAILADLDVTFPQVPGGATSNYIDGVVQNWGKQPYSLGVYSYPKVGTYITANNSKRLDLQKPVANNRIFFAGEASHNTHPATVIGALHEGERAANEVDNVNRGGSGGSSGGGSVSIATLLLLVFLLMGSKRRLLWRSKE